MAGAGTYTIYNNRNATLTITDADGNPRSLIAGSSQPITLSAAGYGAAVALFGSAGVVAQVTNPTYRFVAFAVAPVAAPTDFLIIQGSATKTVNVTRIRLSGAATAQGAMPLSVVRRTTAPVLGSAALAALVPALADVLSDAAPTATVSVVGTANVTTLGTSGGLVDAARLGMPALGTGAAGEGQVVVLRYGSDGGQPIKLRGASDYLCLNFGGAAVPAGGLIDVVVEVYEDNS